MLSFSFVIRTPSGFHLTFMLSKDLWYVISREIKIQFNGVPIAFLDLPRFGIFLFHLHAIDSNAMTSQWKFLLVCNCIGQVSKIDPSVDVHLQLNFSERALESMQAFYKRPASLSDMMTCFFITNWTVSTLKISCSGHRNIIPLRQNPIHRLIGDLEYKLLDD